MREIKGNEMTIVSYNLSFKMYIISWSLLEIKQIKNNKKE